MPRWAELLLGLFSAGLILWVALVITLVATSRRRATPTDVLRLLPDLARLIARLARDRSIPRATRLRLWALLAYLASPIDLIPDFIPVIGYADDALLIGLVLRSVLRTAGPAAIKRHWPGTPAGLGVVQRLAGTRDRPTTP